MMMLIDFIIYCGNIKEDSNGRDDSGGVRGGDISVVFWSEIRRMSQRMVGMHSASSLVCT